MVLAPISARLFHKPDKSANYVGVGGGGGGGERKPHTRINRGENIWDKTVKKVFILLPLYISWRLELEIDEIDNLIKSPPTAQFARND